MKYNEILREVKKERIATAISTAAQLYLSRGINDVKMTDIAEQSQIGVASLYRYFGTKQLFTVKVAAYIWKTTLQELEPLYTGPQYKSLCGYEQAKTLLSIFGIFLDQHKPFLRFLSEFDTFVVKEHLKQEHLQEYETCSLNMLPLMTQAIETGKADGSVKPDVDPTLYYFAVTDTLIAACQRFAWSNMPHSEDAQKNRQILQMAIEVFLSYLRNS